MTIQHVSFDTVDALVADLNVGDKVYVALPGQTEFYLATIVVSEIDTGVPEVKGFELNDAGKIVDTFEGSIDDLVQCHGFSPDASVTETAVTDLNAVLDTRRESRVDVA